MHSSALFMRGDRVSSQELLNIAYESRPTCVLLGPAPVIFPPQLRCECVKLPGNPHASDRYPYRVRYINNFSMLAVYE